MHIFAHLRTKTNTNYVNINVNINQSVMRHSIYIDRRMKRKGGEYPLKVSLTYGGKQLLVNTGIVLAPECWDAAACRVVRHPLEGRLNVRLGQLRVEVDAALMDMGPGLDPAEVKRRLERLVRGEDPEGTKDKPRLLECMRRFADTHTHKRTREGYHATVRRILSFDAQAESLALEDVTAEWLIRFEAHMSLTAKSANSRSYHLRNIRAVLNDAITRGLITEYAFRRFRIKSQPTEHRALPVEDVREILRIEVLPHERQWRDMFVLMILLCGIAPVDLVHLQEIRGGRVTFRRSKTGEPVSIKVEPEAMAIIEWYRGKGQLLDILDRYKDYNEWVRRMDRNLKTLGGVTMEPRVTRDRKTRMVAVKRKRWPKLSAYWARHTWGSIAYSLGVSIDVIGQAMGHSQRRVTEIYIARDNRRVDEANRKVIDWVLYGRR